MSEHPDDPEPLPPYPETLEQALRAAIAEADKGIFVSQEAVHRWMESWGTDNELPMPEPDVFPEGYVTGAGKGGG